MCLLQLNRKKKEKTLILGKHNWEKQKQLVGLVAWQPVAGTLWSIRWDVWVKFIFTPLDITVKALRLESQFIGLTRANVYFRPIFISPKSFTIWYLMILFARLFLSTYLILNQSCFFLFFFQSSEWKRKTCSNCKVDPTNMSIYVHVPILKSQHILDDYI